MARGKTSLRGAFTLADGRWQRLPEWAAWFSDVGYWAAGLRDGDSNAVVALSVPTRDYLAVLLAYGVVNQASQAEVVPAESEQNFEQAKCLPVGTCVRVIPVKGPGQGRRVYTGVFGGAFKNHHGRVYELAGSKALAGVLARFRGFRRTTIGSNCSAGRTCRRITRTDTASARRLKSPLVPRSCWPVSCLTSTDAALFTAS